MRIGEAESLIAGERNPLARRRQSGRTVLRRCDRQRRGYRGKGVDRKIAFGVRREPIDQPMEAGMFAGLDEAEMPLRQSDCSFPWHRAENANAKSFDRVGDEL